ncbi:class I SAM-dependent methyltransferase [Nonomuraea sp. SMC257]|uniref:Class I SAM-dependent methyltransferase n=1 Tax=Nonomuraea montanisoli TaxID=2741721 RepID=A0A7Y6I3L5_9ACTN|nr:class I SAM-dependent methyltransferase [Nonomuraea montanisoli]NUW30533.1 class I SAM-dependent methyltransferase [Nonomuraea montanisoli]
MAGLLTPERTSREIDFLVRSCMLRTGSHVLDLGCGEGRHLRELGRRGVRSTGIDQSPSSVAAARSACAGLPVDVLVGDMRTPSDGTYDAVVCLFNTFALIEQHEVPEVLARWARHLDTGGHLVLDVWNADAIRAEPQRTRRSWQTDDMRVQEDRTIANAGHALRIDYSYTDGTSHAAYSAVFELYTAAELEALLAEAGLTMASVHGTLTGDPLDPRSSPRVVVVGLKR